MPANLSPLFPEPSAICSPTLNELLLHFSWSLIVGGTTPDLWLRRALGVVPVAHLASNLPCLTTSEPWTLSILVHLVHIFSIQGVWFTYPGAHLAFGFKGCVHHSSLHKNYPSKQSGLK